MHEQWQTQPKMLWTSKAYEGYQKTSSPSLVVMPCRIQKDCQNNNLMQPLTYAKQAQGTVKEL